MPDGDSLEAEKLFGEIKEAAQLPSSPQTSGERTTLEGNYELLDEIHRGGQGVVFRARQRSTNRVVAIKFMRHGAFATPRERFRFEREVDLASRLNHPDIVTVFDGGISDGQPYCVMEYVDGLPLNVFAPEDNNARRANESIELFERICRAVGYAHACGVIHRDLKPANVLVTADASPKILDFGLAKTLDVDPDTQHHPRTITGEFVGTLAYASPEQVRLDPGIVDTRSDVYSLGVMLFEFLTGNFPYHVDGSLAETLDHISNSNPPRPTASRADIRLDLETIVLKSLAKEPERRYQNATMLAEDLRRYLDGRPIEARRDSTMYVLGKTLSRHRSAAAGVLGLLLMLIVSLITVSTFYFHAVTQRDTANEAKRQERKQRELEVEHRKLADFRTYSARIAAAEASINSYATHDTLRNLYRTPPEHRAWEYWYLYGRNNLSKSTLGFQDRKQFGHSARIRSLDYHPDGRHLATVSDDGSLVVWDTDTESILSRIELQRPFRVVRFHPDGDRLAAGFVDGDALVLKFDPAEETALKITSLRFSTETQPLNAMQFSHRGDALMIGTGAMGSSGRVLIYDCETAKRKQTIENEGRPVLAVAWGPDDRVIAYGDYRLFVHDLVSGERLHELAGHDNWITAIDFRPDGKHVVSCAYEPIAKIWGVESGRHLKSLFGHTSFVTSAEYSDDSTLIATGSADSTLRLWDARNAAPLETLWGQYGGIEEVSFNHDGQTLATCGTWCAKTWDSKGQTRKPFGAELHTKIVDSVIGPESKSIFTCDLNGRVHEFRLATRAHLHTFGTDLADQTLRGVAVSRDGKYVAWASEDGSVSVHDRASAETRRLLGHQGAVTAVGFGAEGDLFSCSLDGSVRRWNRTTQGTEVVFESDQSLLNVLSSACGRWLAVAEPEHIRVLETDTFEVVVSFHRKRTYEQDGFPMAFSNDGEIFAAATQGSQTTVWSIPDGEALGSLLEHSMPVRDVAFSPCGKRIVTSSREGTIKLWDTQYFQVVLTLNHFNGYAETVQFSPDGEKLVAGLYDGSIEVWESLAENLRPKE